MGGGAGAAEEDGQCANWAAEGYCSHDQFKEYMERSCPSSCGFEPKAADSGGASAAAAAATAAGAGQDAFHADSSQTEEEEEEEEEDEEEAAADESMPGSAAESGAQQDRGASSAASEPANCAAWARQGLCDTGAHVEYMTQNCPRTCESVDASSADAAADEPDAYRCSQWAMQGLCDEGSSHVAYMKLHCAEQCEMAAQRDPDAGKPPPADIWVFLIVGAFGYGAFYAVRRTIQTDGEMSSVVAKKTLGKEVAIGPGKQNKSALQKQVRSAKKS